MIIEALIGTVGVLGMASGIGALVFWKKNGNGRDGPPLARQQDPAQVQLLWPPEVATLLERLEDSLPKLEHPLVQAAPQPPWPEVVGELERITQRVLVAARQPPEPEWASKWASRIESDLAESDNRLVRLAADLSESMTNDMAGFYAGVSKDLTGELTKLADLPARIGRSVSEALDGLTAQIRELVDIGRKKVEEKPPDPPPKSNIKEDAPPVMPFPIPAPPKPRESKPISRSAEPIVLDEFNTLTLDEFVVYELRPPEEGGFQCNVLNLGPGWLYMRENDEPTIGDKKATTLPPGGIDNEVRITRQLYVLASEDGSIAVRVGHA